jgi:DNA polymerase-3 subunit chi
MTEIRFYHLEKQPLEQALPALTAKAYENGHKIVIKTGSAEAIETLDQLLWTYQEHSFLPHGAGKDANAADQPVWITDSDENPNNADVLILTHGAQSDLIKNFTLCCNLFDGRQPEALQKAREQWKHFQTLGFDMTYWQQGERGWEKKDL